MKLSEFKSRVDNLKNSNFVFNKFNNEIKNIYASIFYYLALEVNVDSSMTRQVYVSAINKLYPLLNMSIPMPNYRIWAGIYDTLKDRNINDVTNPVLEFSANRLYLNSDDPIWQLENINMTDYDKDNGKNKVISALLKKRRNEYKGMLGNTYQPYYVDKVLSILSLALKNVGTDRVPIFVSSVNNYTKRVKIYIENGS